MSANPSTPDFSSDHPEFDDPELESLLKSLEPSPLDVGLLDEFGREYERIARVAPETSTDPRWKRLIPLTLAACVVFFSYVAFQYGGFVRGPKPTELAERPVAGEKAPRPRPMRSSAAVDGFVPVSAQGYLIDSSSEGVVDTEEGPRERLNLEYRDAYHWHDPATKTNIRYFKPRSEEVMIPLSTR